MYCSKCNRETDSTVCPICGEQTSEEIEHVVYWCDECRIPIISPRVSNKIQCPSCKREARYLCADLRPVFPEERLLFEIMTDGALAHIQDSVWATGSKYYVNGKPKSISVEQFKAADPDAIRNLINLYSADNSDLHFNRYIEAFVSTNALHLSMITQEASEFIREASRGYDEENLVASFSGGKDSTVTADLAARALSNPYMVHIFGDTTLEFPTTIEYAKRFRDSHPLAIFKTAKNYEQDFYEVAEEIGPPARMMRWCCSMFKTGPITRAFNGLYGNQISLPSKASGKRSP